MSRTLLLAVLLLGSGTPVSAQPALHAGDVVKLSATAVSGRFTVASLTADGLAVRDSAGVVTEVPIASLKRVSVHRGRRSAGRGFLRGAALGGGIGAGSGVIMGLASGDDDAQYTFFALTAEEKAVLGAIVLGGAGAVVGGLIGALAPGDRWERVRFDGPVTVGLRAGGIGVGYTYRF